MQFVKHSRLGSCSSAVQISTTMDQAYSKTLNLSKKHFNKTFGFTMDFGGSAIKIIYTSEEGDNIRLNLFTYPREQQKEAFAMLLDKCAGKIDPGTEVFTCGVGASEYNEELTKLFNLTFTNMDEIQFLIEGFLFMAKQIPWSEFVQPISKSAMLHGQKYAETYEELMSVMTNMPGYTFTLTKFTELAKVKAKETNDDSSENIVKYPIVLVLIGSASGVLKIEEDGSYMVLEEFPTAGKAFLALGSFLTNTKTFDDLCDRAKNGNPQNVDMYISSIEVNPDDELYGKAVEIIGDMKAFSFGHGVGKNKEDFKNDDIAASLVSLIVDPIVKSSYGWATHHGIKQVFVTGSFACNNAFIQEEFARIFACKRFCNSEDFTCDCYFLKLGAHCGSIGAILKNLEISKDIITTYL